jgi:D-alanyl-D-alanine carboxypeptidase
LNGGVTYREPARTTTRRIRRIRVAGLLVVIGAIAAALGYQSLASSSSPASSSSTAASPIDVLRSEHRGALGEADGAVPDGTSVFDDEIPGVANLDPALLGALRQAAADAADDGVEFFVDSGWRSPQYQEQLLHEAVSKYGSEEEAARWVATPSTSAHVSGDAVDIGPFDATAWLSEHGAEYGLCQIYSNEPWHYELRPEAIDHGCPSMYTDPMHDPRIGEAQRGQSLTGERDAASGRAGPRRLGPSRPPLGRG